MDRVLHTVEPLALRLTVAGKFKQYWSVDAASQKLKCPPIIGRAFERKLFVRNVSLSPNAQGANQRALIKLALNEGPDEQRYSSTTDCRT